MFFRIFLYLFFIKSTETITFKKIDLLYEKNFLTKKISNELKTILKQCREDSEKSQMLFLVFKSSSFEIIMTKKFIYIENIDFKIENSSLDKLVEIIYKKLFNIFKEKKFTLKYDFSMIRSKINVDMFLYKLKNIFIKLFHIYDEITYVIEYKQMFKYTEDTSKILKNNLIEVYFNDNQNFYCRLISLNKLNIDSFYLDSVESNNFETSGSNISKYCNKTEPYYYFIKNILFYLKENTDLSLFLKDIVHFKHSRNSNLDIFKKFFLSENCRDLALLIVQKFSIQLSSQGRTEIIEKIQALCDCRVILNFNFPQECKDECFSKSKHITEEDFYGKFFSVFIKILRNIENFEDKTEVYNILNQILIYFTVSNEFCKVESKNIIFNVLNEVVDFFKDIYNNVHLKMYRTAAVCNELLVDSNFTNQKFSEKCCVSLFITNY